MSGAARSVASARSCAPEEGSEASWAGPLRSTTRGNVIGPAARRRVEQAALRKKLHLSRILDKVSSILYTKNMTTTTRHPARPHVGDIRTLAEELIATRLPDEAEWIIAVGDLAQIEKRTAEALHLAVSEARGLGYSWQEIGDLLGVTRSAAQQRFRT